MGDKISTIEKSTHLIEKKIGTIEKISTFYESEPWGFDTNEWFINRVVAINTLLSPEELLKQLLAIESLLGRIRNTENKGYSSRTIDLDILFFNHEIIENKNLTIPHPRLHLRKFTLLPLVELYPDFIHPIFNQSLKALLDKCDDSSKVIHFIK